MLYGLVICDYQYSDEDESDYLDNGYTIGRTRNMMRSFAKEPREKSESYCCFWIHQDHPALPDAVDVAKKYPFKFVLNGKIWIPSSTRSPITTTAKM